MAHLQGANLEKEEVNEGIVNITWVKSNDKSRDASVLLILLVN